MSLELLFLGTGTSAGVPMIGCDCAVCRSDDPRDQRTRPSVLIRYPAGPDQPPRPSDTAPPPAGPTDAHGATSAPPRSSDGLQQYLIDTPPEMRVQVIRHDIRCLNGVLLTHAHADHVFGLDDLRRFNAVMKSPLDLYADTLTHERLGAMFSYIFHPHTNINRTFIPRLIPHRVEPSSPLNLGSASWTPLRLLHGRLPILGFRVDLPSQAPPAQASADPPRTRSLAYCTDVSRIPPETYPFLYGLDVLVIDALRYRHHPTHMTVDQALAVIEQVRPSRAYLTHIAHDIMHAELEPRLPEHVHVAYDGLAVRC